jgi:hypothetical protein
MRGKIIGWRAYLFLVIGLLVIGPFGATAGAAETLVVTVEVGRREPLAADEIRAAVASEVGGKVIRAAAQDPATSSDILLIDVDQGQVGMVFRSHGGAARRRSMMLPPAREDGLRLIGWMAMNLVRDQLEGIAPAQPREAPVGPASRPNPYFDEPRNNPFVRVEPPVEVERSLPVSADVLSPQRITLSAFGGLALLRGWTADYVRVATTSARLELEAEFAVRRLAFGLMVGMDSGMGQGGGGAAYAGYVRKSQKLKLEASAGLGLWMTGGSLSSSDRDASGRFYAQAMVEESRRWLFGRTHATVSYALYRWLDCSFRASLNVGLVDLRDSSLAGLLGLRVNL